MVVAKPIALQHRPRLFRMIAAGAGSLSVLMGRSIFSALVRRAL